MNISLKEDTSPSYTPLGHMLILCQPVVGSNITYLLDAWFGGSGLVRPILLSDASDNIVLGTTPTEKHRLTRGKRLDSSLGELLQLISWHMKTLTERW